MRRKHTLKAHYPPPSAESLFHKVPVSNIDIFEGTHRGDTHEATKRRQQTPQKQLKTRKARKS